MNKITPPNELSNSMISNRESEGIMPGSGIQFKSIPKPIPQKFRAYLFDEPVLKFPSQLRLSASSDYSIHNQVELCDLMFSRGYRPARRDKYKWCITYRHYLTREHVYVAKSEPIRKKVARLSAERNYKDRKQAGRQRRGAQLGIVGSNLDVCNTRYRKQVRGALFGAQEMIQKVRLDGKKIISDNVAACGKPIGAKVSIDQNLDHNSASVSSIHTCKSVWACPVCRNRIISKRAEELKQIYEAATEKGYQVNMLTLTVPHGKEDNLAELYGSNLHGTGLSGALSKFRQSRHFSKVFKQQTGYIGDVRGIEVTWGRANGFHPHIHILMITEYSFDFESWKMRFYEAWADACAASGLERPSFRHGIDISHCNDASGAEYLAKWSAANEMTSQSMKQARSGNFSIAELERCLSDKQMRDNRQIGMTKVAAVLKSYYASMKGQRMLQTGGNSKGQNWKQELIDTDLNENDTDNHVRTCFIENREYIKIKRHGNLSAMLEATEQGETRAGRILHLKKWLRENDYHPGAVSKPYQNSPPPICFSRQSESTLDESSYKKVMARIRTSNFRDDTVKH